MPTSANSSSPGHKEAAACLTSSKDGFVRNLPTADVSAGDISCGLAFLQRRTEYLTPIPAWTSHGTHLVVSAEGRAWVVTAHWMTPAEGGKGVRLVGSMLDRASRVAKVVKAATEPASDVWPPAPMTAREWAVALEQEDPESHAA